MNVYGEVDLLRAAVGSGSHGDSLLRNPFKKKTCWSVVRSTTYSPFLWIVRVFELQTPSLPRQPQPMTGLCEDDRVWHFMSNKRLFYHESLLRAPNELSRTVPWSEAFPTQCSFSLPFFSQVLELYHCLKIFLTYSRSLFCFIFHRHHLQWVSFPSIFSQVSASWRTH